MRPAARGVAYDGSSPLTRGKRFHVERGPVLTRLIPAHAGKTRPEGGDGTRCPAHPRSRGENGSQTRAGSQPLGSSPLTRGKPRHHGPDGGVGRLIPAHAGKTLVRRRPGRVRRAHPRSRGENHQEVTLVGACAGSSPLTRGKPLLGEAGARDRGLIPAHAGKTLRVHPWVHLLAAHPRSRGENCVASAPGFRRRGSSPLTRGKLHALMPVLPQVGLIPAHAGKTIGGTGTTSENPAHPRSRGENFDPSACGHPFQGSSPLTRGKRRRRQLLDSVPGLIPAHAGKTAWRATAANPASAHPRSRGENGRRTR